MKPPSMTSSFWQSFASRYWEQAPLKIDLKSCDKDPSLSGIAAMDAVAIFEMLVQYSDRCRRKKEVLGLKLFVDGIRQYDEEVLQILPVKKDKTLLGYHDRISAIYPDYCLVCDELLQVSHQYWALLVNFSQGLFSQIGLPYRFAEMGLYLGNYKKTPFGVHVDGCGVFSFPVVGEKRFRLWTSEFADKNPKLKMTFNYSRFKKDSDLMLVKPGEMSYWPSKAWHIAESQGEFSATWSLGVWVDREEKDFVVESLTPLFKRELSDAKTCLSLNQKKSFQSAFAKKLPGSLKLAASDIQKLSKLEIEDRLLSSWLKQSSKQGFKTGPVVAPLIGLTQKSKIQALRARPILSSRSVLTQELYVAFDGQLLKTRVDKKFEKLLQDLNSGLVCSVDKYLNRTQFEKHRSVMEQLASIGAFQHSK